MRKNLILNSAKAIFSAYRSDQYVDHDGFVTQLAVVLEQYPDEVIRYVSNPVTGIQHQSKFPPSIAEVVAACEKFKLELELARQRVVAEAEAHATLRLGQNFGREIRKRIPPDQFWSWFSQMRLVQHSADQITLDVRSEFFRQEIFKRFNRQICEAANVKYLVLLVDENLKNVNRGPAPFDKDGNPRFEAQT